MKSNINESPLKSYNSIPRYWEARPKTQLYNTLHESELILDGWRDIIIPEHNSETKKLGDLIIVNDLVTHVVVDLTAQEIADRQQDALDADTSAQKLNQATADGSIMFQRFLAFIQRLFDEGTISGAQARNSAQLLYLPLLPLKDGQFQLAKANVDGLPVPTNQKELAILNKAKEQLNTYLQ